MSAVSDSIERRIRAKGHGFVLSPSDFLDLDGRAAVDQTLSRPAARGECARADDADAGEGGLADGRPGAQTVIGRRFVELKHARLKRMAGARPASSTVIQALR